MMIGFYGSAFTVGGVFVALFTCTIIESVALAPQASVTVSVRTISSPPQRSVGGAVYIG